MARASSLLALLACAGAAGAQSFGRFGYTLSPSVPGFKIDSGGFAASFPTADRFSFVKPSVDWRPYETAETHQVVGLTGGDGLPSKLRVDLTGPGFSLYCPHALRLRLSSTAAPYLTWTDGSAGPNVPTPDLNWVVVSFADAQPALIFGVPSGKASFIVRGKAGDWTLHGDSVDGWIRVGLVSGVRPTMANSAHTLGELVNRAAIQKDLFTQMPPVPTQLRVESDPLSVTATWTFDRPGAIVPVGATMAPIGGYQLKVLSATREIDAPTEEGPIEVVNGSELRIRFPTKRIPAGRALALNPPDYTPLATISPIDIPSVVELALSNLVSTSDGQCRKQAEDAYSDYLSTANYIQEPWTRQQLPYGADGAGIDLAAAHALLMQSITSTLKPTSESNALLSSVAWRRDWNSWQIWTSNRVAGRRASALAAIAACLCPEPERRLDGAMLEAGLAAERGVQIWLRRRGLIEKELPLLEPMGSMRMTLFTAKHREDVVAQYASSLFSPLRVYGTTSVRLLSGANGYLLAWPAVEPKPAVLSFASGFPIGVTAKTNLGTFAVAQAFGITELHYVPEGVGTCEAVLSLPGWVTSLPKATIVPAYSETTE